MGAGRETVNGKGEGEFGMGWGSCHGLARARTISNSPSPSPFTVPGSGHKPWFLLAALVATFLAGPAAWGHSFPAARSVVVQVEPCAVVLLVGYRPGTGEDTRTLLAEAGSIPKSQALKDLLTAHALAPLALSIDGRKLVPTSVRAKIGAEPGGARPMVVVLVTYALPAGAKLTLATTDSRNTRISWQDRASGRVANSDAPQQDHWFDGVASLLLELTAATGGSVCASSSSPHSS